MVEALVISVFVLIGVVTQRAIGFGGSPFIVLSLLLYFSPPVAISVMLLIGTTVFLLLLYNDRKSLQLSKPIVYKICIAGIPGAILGAFIVTRIDKAPLQIIIGVLIVIAALIQEYASPKPNRRLKVSKGISIAGFAGGLFNGIAVLGGAPVILYLRSHVVSADQIRQHLAAVFIFLNLVSVIAIHTFKPASLSAGSLRVFALLLPLVLIGNYLGRVIAGRLNRKAYEKIAFIGILFVGFVGIAVGIANL